MTDRPNCRCLTPLPEASCPGPLVWFEGPGYLILECAACDYVHVGSGVPFRDDHVGTETLKP